MPIQYVTVHESDAGSRVDTLLAAKTGITRSQLQKLIANGHVRLGDGSVNQNYRVRDGDVLVVDTGEPEDDGLVPEPLPVPILYRDPHLVVVEKPAGMVVYPAAGHRSGTLMNALLYHCGKLASVGAPLRPGVVHRLDRDTSGVMVVALDDDAYYDLVRQFSERTIQRKYLALIYGEPSSLSGEIRTKIGRSVSDRKKMSTRTKRGKEAVTQWKAARRFRSATMVEVKLGTGRTHQIRVHFASIGHPVLGDRTYGKRTLLRTAGDVLISFPRQMLHAERLGFVHPSTGEYLEFSTPLPADMLGKIRELEENF